MTRRRRRSHPRGVVFLADRHLALVDLFVELKKEDNVTIVAILGKDGSRKINPKGEKISEGDVLVVIASHDFEG